MSARNLIAAADQIEARIVEAEKLRAALEEIKRLHAPVTVCAYCHLKECPGDDCDFASGYLDEPERVCGICCWDNNDNAREQVCIDSHEHVDGGPACSTAEIIARAEL